jgi:hypothetical protein
MPKSIKNAALALIFSCIATLIAAAVEGIWFEGLGFDEPLIFGTNLLWIVVVAWLIYDVIKNKNDIRIAIGLVSLLSIGFLISDFIDFGFNLAQAFYAFEIILFGVALYYLSIIDSKAWYEDKKSKQA